MSTGTENIVFNRNFDEGTHWARYATYPHYPGYASVGRVVALGEGVKGLQIGDRVAVRVAHRSMAVVPESQCYKIPAGIPYEQAVWFAFSKISFLGVRAARLSLGDTAMILGAGPVGQMAIRWAKVAGVSSLAVVDMAKARESQALAGGADRVHVGPVDQILEQYRANQHGAFPRVVIDTTGNHRVFAPALSLTAKFGTVVLLGDSGQPGQQGLTSDVMAKGLTITGVHDSHNPPDWPQSAIIELFFSLVQSRRFPVDGLVSHRFSPEDCGAAYRVANVDRANTMGILFNWVNSDC